MRYDGPCKYQFTFMIEPRVKKAPVLGRNGFYKHKTTSTFERQLRCEAQAVFKDPPIEGVPLAVLFKFFLPHQSKPESSLQFCRPDTTNLLKSAEDALNGVIWKDDGVIQSLSGEKYYSKVPRLELYVWVLG